MTAEVCVIGAGIIGITTALELQERGVDVLLDMVAGSYMQKNLDSMARDGRYAIIAFLKGPRAELNMRVMEVLAEKFPDVVIGFSSHDSGIAMAVAS